MAGIRHHDPSQPGGNPPQWAVRFFKWFCRDYLAEAALGDLEELYFRRRAELGKRKADFLFVCNVLLFLRPFAVKRKTSSLYSINLLDMFRNYFKIAWRTMARQKMYTSITIGGFALGLATCLVIFLFIRHELSFDRHYRDGDRIFKFYSDYNDGSETNRWTNTPPMVAGILKTEYPEVESAGRFMNGMMGGGANSLFRREDQVEDTYEEGFAFADPEVLNILEIPMVYGSTAGALSKPFTIVLSKRKADKYFPGENPVGKTVVINDENHRPYTVGGVMEDRPVNSHFQYDFLITLKDWEFWPGEQTDWCCWNYNMYVKLRPGADRVALEKKLLNLRDTYLISYLEKMGDQSAADMKKYHSYRLEPVADIHLNPDHVYDEHRHGDVLYVWLFGGIAVFVLLLACINFINLSTAKSAGRAREVGLRKAVGSVRGHLVSQFLTESFLQSLIAFAIALLIAEIALPYFNAMGGAALTLPWSLWWFLPGVVLCAVCIGVLAGVYPSFYLSSFRPADVLKGNLSRGSQNPGLRSAMVVFQFTTSVVLIVGTLVIYRQMNFILEAKTGFDKDQVLLIQGTNTLGDRTRTFKEELLRVKDVEHVSVSAYLPVAGTNREGYGFWLEGHEKTDKPVTAQKWRVDEDYLRTMHMQIVQGRDFIPDQTSNAESAVINQAMAREMGLKNPLGERISNGHQKFTVIGVVADFNFETMKDAVEPLCLVVEGGGNSITSVRLNTKNMVATVEAIGEAWKRFMPHQPFRYSFLDERFANMYADVQRMGHIFAVFATLAIVVACLGLFALSSFMIEQRSKEVSIRLVLGASTRSIFNLLTAGFMKLVLVSLLIAVPLSWYFMQHWLESYTYRAPLTADVFVIAGAIALAVAAITISYQAVRASLVSPAQRLRSE
jgi:putative ABC transport system permease protein